MMAETSPSKRHKRRLRKLRKSLRAITAYPPEGHGRRTKDGYPTEFAYDEFAYKRMVNSFRDAIRKAVDESLTGD